ncbi:MAG: gliding motility-associated C-terminal domain-containing protein [Ferruginibacter sp.]
MRTVLTIFSFFILQNISAQNLVWAKHFEVNNHQEGIGFDVTTDAAGNVYSVGHKYGVIDMDPGPGVFNLTNTTSYISKLDANGNFIWAKSFDYIPGGVSTESSPRVIKLDAAGNIYVAGVFFGSIDFDPGPGVAAMTITNFTCSNGFICKLDNNGNFIWVKNFGSDNPQTYCYVNDIAIDATGNITSTGYFSGLADLDPGPGASNISAPIQVYNSYVSKLDTNGNFIWGKQIGNSDPGSTDVSGGNSITVDVAGNYYIAGTYNGTTDFDPGPSIFTMPVPGSTPYILKLDVNGDLVWAKSFSGFAAGQVGSSYCVELDPAANLIVTGDFIGTADFDPGPSVYNLTSQSGSNSDIFIVKLDLDGNFIWAKRTGGGGSANVAIDQAGNIFITGFFIGTVDMDPGPGIYSMTSAGNSVDILVAKFDNNGNLGWAIGTGSPINEWEMGEKCSLDAQGNLLLTGYFVGDVDFDPGPGTNMLSSPDNFNPFVWKLSNCNNSTNSVINATSCNAYTLNNQTYTSSGSYTQTLTNSSGCDSVITLNLVIGGSTTNLYDTACNSYTWEGQSYNNSGTYTVTLTGAGGCDSVRILHLVIKASSNTTENIRICEGQSYNGYTVTGTYSNTYTAANGCDSIHQLYLQVDPLPAGFLKKQDSICMHDKLLIKCENSYSTYLWSTGSNQNNITIHQPGQYWLTVTTTGGCSGTDSILISPKTCNSNLCTLQAPNAFTPNGDAMNDLWVIKNLACYKKADVFVYNRYGTLVFRKYNYQNDWDGTYHSKTLPDGTYYYLIKATNNQLSELAIKGTVTILR